MVKLPMEPTYDEATQSFINVGPQLGCQPLEGTPMSIGHTTVKGYVEEVFNMKHDEIWANFGCVFVFLAVFRVLSLLAIRYVNHQKR
ncbi:hypothetical protein PHYSODRAFT_321023 [Phytophthora sojae]|uniref:CDR ABC transporter domain-containing protein n=1 Tax=Phytophthora sojae (strain P6497) TaxID=1094619 RepID=G4YLY2_PHYSP|nr:hypothetical protein PHYSODRAFT_321023 [Phytophthora sojae]EGZ27177.1 hypothetical protein PHYSODRAFT_321023 [Phytophthora sojae]|eukprot:XP_009514452.1 hypothetical protein PHYSODRAFT_321023 [Phytophthora sojae]